MSAGESRHFEISHRTVLLLAVPMMLAYLTTPLLGLVDTAVIGQFGNAALIGGLAVGAIIIDLVFTTFNFLRAGTTALTAQALGSNNETELQATLYRALTIAIVGGLVVILISPLILKAGIWFMQPSRDVAEATKTYFLIRMLSSPFALANYVIIGWLLGLGKAGTTLAVQILLNGTNIALSLYLGLHLGWSITGVATATVIGEAVAFVVGIWICWMQLHLGTKPTRSQLLNANHWKRLVNLNADIMIRSFALLFAFAYFTAQGNGFGEVTLAANAILMQFFLTAGYFLDGLATAAEQLVGRSIGAKFKAGFWRSFKLTILWNSIMALVCSAVFWLAGTWLIELMSTSREVRLEAQTYLIWAILIPLTGMLAFQMDGVYIGATWSREMSIMMLVSLVCYLVFWHLVKDPFGNHGLWLALHMFLLMRGLTLSAILNRKVRQTFPA